MDPKQDPTAINFFPWKRKFLMKKGFSFLGNFFPWKIVPPWKSGG